MSDRCEVDKYSHYSLYTLQHVGHDKNQRHTELYIQVKIWDMNL